MTLLRRDPGRQDFNLVGDLPQDVWAALTDEERDFVIVLDGACKRRFTVVEMRDRIEKRNEMWRQIRETLNPTKVTQYDVQEKGEAVSIPISSSIRVRPVWRRRQQRFYHQNPLAPPTDEEMHDAILVLADPSSERDAPALWIEAQTILDEASPGSPNGFYS